MKRELYELLKLRGQHALLRHYAQLSSEDQEALERSIVTAELPEVLAEISATAPASADRPAVEQSPRAPASPARSSLPVEALIEVGEEALRAGKVAALVVAGGQGSRLGFNGPKGLYPARPLTKTSLFEHFAEQLHTAQRKVNTVVPWLIMTSPQNDRATREYFRAKRYFGLLESQVYFFPQGTLPGLSREGEALLASPTELATFPDGHGGLLRALERAGLFAELETRGVEQLSYFQVDNPLIPVLDPLFIGFHLAGEDPSKPVESELSSKWVAKRAPSERVGIFAERSGRLGVIEYSQLPQSLAEQEDISGQLAFRHASIAAHMISIKLLKRSAERAALPLNQAYRSLETWLEGELQRVDGVKLERFIFDLLPLAERPRLLQVNREDEFAPIKNREGEDSPESSARLQSERNARWLEEAGVEIERDHSGELDAETKIEISPLVAMSAKELVEENMRRNFLPERVKSKMRFCLEITPHGG